MRLSNETRLGSIGPLFSLVIVAVLLTLIAPSGLLADDLFQDFESWPRTANFVLSSNENWVANDAWMGRISGDATYTSRSGTNACWLPFYYPGVYSDSWMRTPRLATGVGTFSFYAKCGLNSPSYINIEISTDEQATWTNIVSTQVTATVWSDPSTFFTVTINEYNPTYVRIRKTGPSDTDFKFRYLGIDDISVTNPPAGIFISGTTNIPSDVLEEQEADITTTITTLGLVSNLEATVYWRADPLDDYTEILMETNGSPTSYKTSTPIPGQDVIPGTPIEYYIKVAFEGPEAAPVYDPTTYATDPYYYVIRKGPLDSDFETMKVRILTETDEDMYGILDEVWRKVVTPAGSFDTPQFLFEGVNTNGTDTNTWGDAYQAISNLAVYGTAQETNSTIVIEGVHTGHLAFTFYESNLFYSAENCVYVNFDGTWPTGWDNWGSHTNSEGWQIIDGRLTNNGGETNKAFETVGNSCVLRNTTGDQYVLSPYLDNGVGEVSLQYRNGWWSGDYEARAGFYIEKSVDGNEWIRIATLSDIRSRDYLYYSLNVADRNYHYIRIRNSTNDPHGRLLLDEITITEPVTGVSFTNLMHSPPDPDIASNVNISVEITPFDRTSNLTAYVWYRAGTNGSFDSIAMTNTHDNYFVTETPVRKGIKGIVHYYV
ncbi:MAG: hypothetical protein HQ559_07415, partial [Lentisphaerae bacterium]|nr:hypothetical protein [Lentisphaerota bacterium]